MDAGERTRMLRGATRVPYANSVSACALHISEPKRLLSTRSVYTAKLHAPWPKAINKRSAGGRDPPLKTKPTGYNCLFIIKIDASPAGCNHPVTALLLTCKRTGVLCSAQ